MSTAQTYDVKCPHCKKSFKGELMGEGDRRGFKCPHCRLFVPESRADESRAEDAPLSRDRTS